MEPTSVSDSINELLSKHVSPASLLDMSGVSTVILLGWFNSFRRCGPSREWQLSDL